MTEQSNYKDLWKLTSQAEKERIFSMFLKKYGENYTSDDFVKFLKKNWWWILLVIIGITSIYIYYRNRRNSEFEEIEKISLKKILTRHSTYRRHLLKKRLLENDLLPYICAICGISQPPARC